MVSKQTRASTKNPDLSAFCVLDVQQLGITFCVSTVLVIAYAKAPSPLLVPECLPITSNAIKCTH